MNWTWQWHISLGISDLLTYPKALYEGRLVQWSYLLRKEWYIKECTPLPEISTLTSTSLTLSYLGSVVIPGALSSEGGVCHQASQRHMRGCTGFALGSDCEWSRLQCTSLHLGCDCPPKGRCCTHLHISNSHAQTQRSSCRCSLNQEAFLDLL